MKHFKVRHKTVTRLATAVALSSLLMSIVNCTKAGTGAAGLTPAQSLNQDSPLPTGLIINQQSTSVISMSWSGAAPGTFGVDHYHIYRNGVAYGTSTTNAFTDTNATNASNPNFTAADTIYSYSVAAVDAQGNEGAQTTQSTFLVYFNGRYNWGINGSNDQSFNLTPDYADTAGAPESGAYDIALTGLTSQGGAFQMVAGTNVSSDLFEAGSFKYLQFDVKPQMTGQQIVVSLVSSSPTGDNYPWAAVEISNYGPNPVAGMWATYKIPLSALSVGTTSITASISGNTMTVTGLISGVGIDVGGFITGTGVAPGTYVTGYNNVGGPGTYTVTPAQTVSGEIMTEQRTGIDKINIYEATGSTNGNFYLDNIMFTAQ